MLAKILSQKRRELERIDFERGIKKIRKSLPQLDETRSLTRSLAEEEGISLIAEIKRRSPSKGLLAPDLDVEKTTSSYEKAGAKAISVLTEKNFFDGSFQDLELAHECTRLPILRKDFILEEFQVWESRYLGADAILLIVAILDPEKLRRFHSLARQIGLEVLVEVHTEEELGEALKAGSEMVGINNRNLETFEVKLEVTERLEPLLPQNVACVSESGIKTRADVLRMQDLGVDAVLVGETIVRSRDPDLKIKELLGKRK